MSFYNPDADINAEMQEDVETSGCFPVPLPDVAKGFSSVKSTSQHVSLI